MYSTAEENRFLEVTYQNGDKEVLYYRDFSSGAMIENVVRRAKKLAIKREIADEVGGIRTDDLLESIRQEYKENEDLPEHDQPRRLGADLGQEGRADRLRPHPIDRGPRDQGRPLDRAGRDRPVPLSRSMPEPGWPLGQGLAARTRARCGCAQGENDMTK